MSFTTNKGRTLSWGFKDVTNATRALIEAPVPGSYLAAVRGLEGKPAPVSKKRWVLVRGNSGAAELGELMCAGMRV